MATVTAGALISAGLRMANMVDAPGAFIDHPAAGGGEAFDMLNAALSALYDIIMEDEASAYSANNTSWTTTQNLSAYPLATVTGGATFYRLQGVDYWNGWRWIPLARVNLADRDNYPAPNLPAGYAEEGDNLVIYPAPAGVYTMQIRWESLPPECAANADTVDLKGPWKEFCVKHFAIGCRDKEDTDATQWRIDLWGPNQDGNGGLAQRIRNASKRRDAGQATAPVDVQERHVNDLPPYARWTG